MNNAKVCLWASMVCLWWASAAAPAHAQGGLRVVEEFGARQDAWPRWQARVGLAAAASPLDAGTRWQLSAGQLLGDYYLSALQPTDTGRYGGFRATSGLLFGQRSLVLGTPAPTLARGAGLSLSRSVRTAHGLGEAPAEAWTAVPYFGIGYSGVSLRAGWGFSADLGLAGTTGGLRLRRDGALGSQGLDELLRELRLTPVLQFGASYAF